MAQKKKAKYIGLHFHDLCRTGIRNLSKKGTPEKVGMLISGRFIASVYANTTLSRSEVLKTAAAKINETRQS